MVVTTYIKVTQMSSLLNTAKKDLLAANRKESKTFSQPCERYLLSTDSGNFNPISH